MLSSDKVPSLAQTLPPEVLDHILSIHFTSTNSLTSLKTGKSLSLVCRHWRGPVQRILLQSVKVVTVAGMRDLARIGTGLGQLVNSLEVKVVDGKNRWKVRDLNELLESLPKLKNLSLHLNANSPGSKGSYVQLQSLPHLTALTIQSDKYDKTLCSWKQILAATPNIISLTLGNEPANIGVLPANPNSALIDLPSLKSLSLMSRQLLTVMDRVTLLSKESLKGLTKLELDPTGQWSFGGQSGRLPPEHLMNIVGVNITSLTLPSRTLRLSLTCSQIIEACPNLKNLITLQPLPAFEPPPSLVHIKFISSKTLQATFYPHQNLSTCDWIFLYALPYSNDVVKYIECDWGNVKTFEVENATPTQKVKDAIVKKGVELIIDGVVYKPASDAT